MWNIFYQLIKDNKYDFVCLKAIVEQQSLDKHASSVKINHIYKIP